MVTTRTPTPTPTPTSPPNPNPNFSSEPQLLNPGSASSNYTQCDVISGRNPANDSLAIYTQPMRAMERLVLGASYSAPVPDWLWPNIFSLFSKRSNLVGICVDDYPYTNLTSLKELRHQLHTANRTQKAEIFSTFYTWDLNKTGISDFLGLIDRPILWTWDSGQLNATIEESFPAFEKITGPGRMLGLYAYDFGYGTAHHRCGDDCHGRPMSPGLMERQLSWALGLLKQGRVSGIAFEGLYDLGLPASEQLRDWVRAARHL